MLPSFLKGSIGRRGEGIDVNVTGRSLSAVVGRHVSMTSCSFFTLSTSAAEMRLLVRANSIIIKVCIRDLPSQIRFEFLVLK